MTSPYRSLRFPGLALGLLLPVAAASCSGGENDSNAPEPDGGTAATGGSGGGGAGKDGGATDAPVASARAVVLSEIMYHPVLEEAAEDFHEFVELHNRADAAVSLAGWKLAGDVAFTFPAGATIGPKQYLVVAKDKAKLAAAWGLKAETLQGSFTGDLDNGRGKVSLVDASGMTVESVEYRDEFPWPVSADALGAGDRWLPATWLPLDKHKYKGRSLQRVSFDAPAAEAASWDVSDKEGATPERANAVSGTPGPIAEALTASAATKKEGLIAAADEVRVEVTFSKGGTVKDVEIEHFVDDVAKTDEPKAVVKATAGAGGAFTATLPAQKEGSVVRYRVFGDRGKGREQLSPRATDPFAWHAYFVSPPAGATNARQYHLFIAPQDWGQLWTNANDGQISGCAATEKVCMACTPSKIYNERVPAIFVDGATGKVYDVFARYGGSRHNRRSGAALVKFDGAKPLAGPEPLLALSWNIKFPKYRLFDGKDTLSLNKNTQNVCQGIQAGLGSRLLDAVGLPAFHSRFARVNINGAYYHYMREWVETGEQLAKKIEPMEKRTGDLFESVGYHLDEGPWGIGNEAPMKPFCNFDAKERYRTTYDRETNGWASHDALIKLIEDLAAARAAGPAATKAFLEKNFDTKALIDHVALLSWAKVWDDAQHNHLLYQRVKDGKWLLVYNDWDYMFSGPTESPYIGEEGDRSNGSMDANGMRIFNHVKDALYKSMRPEYNARLTELMGTVLSEAKVGEAIDAAAADISLPDAMAAPVWTGAGWQRCDVKMHAAGLKDFAKKRNAYVPTALKP